MGDLKPNDWLQLSPSLAILLAVQFGINVEAAKGWRPSVSWSGGKGWMGELMRLGGGRLAEQLIKVNLFCQQLVYGEGI